MAQGTENMSPAFLGLDIGTSAVKAVLVDHEQAVVGQAAVPLGVSRPRPGWSEQDPEDWWTATLQAIGRLRTGHGEVFRRIVAIGLTGQMHGAVLLDQAGDPIRPAILWNDSRAADESAWLNGHLPDIGREAGVIAMPGLTAPKLIWLRKHEPEAFARIHTVLLPKDYIRLRLTGELATDMSDAAGTLWLDQAARAWSPSALTASGIVLSQMPALMEGNAHSGVVVPTVRKALGFTGPVVVAAGGGDAAVAAVGIGAIEPGDAFLSLGTSAQFFVTSDRHRPAPEFLLHAFAHALPERWYTMAAMLNGASCLEWLAGVLGADVGSLVDDAEAEFRRPSDILFLPYLSGERTPHNNPDARGVFFGMRPGTSRADLVQATLDGVIFTFMDAQAALNAAGLRFEAVGAVGGGARSRFWMRLFSSALGLPVVRYAGSESGPAFGAARLARLAWSGEAPAAVCGKPAVADVSLPDAALRDAYAERFAAFRSLYRSLEGEFRLSATRGE